MSKNYVDINGKIVLVTGANRGIGKAIVIEALNRGAKKVYAAARDLEKLNELVKNNKEKIIPVKLDLEKDEDLESIAKKVRDIQVLINNAGVLSFASVLSDDLMDNYKKNINVNFYAVMKLTKALFPLIKKNSEGKGAIVNLSSMVGLFNMPSGGMYSISKAAVHSYTQALRAELSKDNILVSGVYPGPVDTDMLKGVEMEKDSPKNVAEAIFAGLKEGREYIFPDTFSKSLENSISPDFIAAEKQFAQFL